MTWPVAVVTGFLGSGKTTLVRALLMRDGMADTLVVVNEFGAVGIDHELIAAVHDDVVLLRGGCLCCGIRRDLAHTLRDLHLRWHAGTIPPFARVIVETSGLADPGPVVATLAAHPLVHDAYRLRTITTLVDAEHGLARLAKQPVGRRQVAAADRLLISKPDRAGGTERAALAEYLQTINPVAEIGESYLGASARSDLFATHAAAPPRHWRAEAVELIPGHTDGIVCTTLRCNQALRFDWLQRWLAGLLDAWGDRLLRLKGLLHIVGSEVPIVLQAVQHTVYPLDTLPCWTAERSNTLVLISDHALPPGLEASFAECAPAGRG